MKCGNCSESVPSVRKVLLPVRRDLQGLVRASRVQHAASALNTFPARAGHRVRSSCDLAAGQGPGLVVDHVLALSGKRLVAELELTPWLAVWLRTFGLRKVHTFG